MEVNEMIKKEVNYTRVNRDGSVTFINAFRWVPTEEEKMERIYKYVQRKETIERINRENERIDSVFDMENDKIFEAISEYLDMHF